MLQTDKTYFLKVVAGDKILRFTAKITNVGEDFVSFIDRKGEVYNINKSLIFSYNELNSSEGRE